MTPTARQTQLTDAGRLSALFLALCGVACIALGAVLAAASETQPIATGFWRMALAAPLCIALAVAARGRPALSELAALLRKREAWIAGVAFAATLIFWYGGQRLSSVASTSALHNLAPVLIVTTGWLFYGDRPEKMRLMGVAAALAGAVALALHSSGMSGRALHGDVLACFAAAALAVYYATVARIAGAGAWTIMAAVSMIAAPILLVCAAGFETDLAPRTGSGWGKLVLLAIFAQVLGQACLARAAQHLGALGVSAAALAEPAMAALLAAALLAAPVHSLQIAGIALVASGIWFSQKRAER